VQDWAPRARVVKTLNLTPTSVMTDPTDRGVVPAIMWITGDNRAAKLVTAGVLRDLGWGEVVDLGGIEVSRMQEAFGLLVTVVISQMMQQSPA
jgi:predicted dinucleotide-binding enzyme